mmetsp:Transcript_22481/g.73006  ORF Transcript_22481/g.73006 Transcript_22481/m.73006 type:complete len:83 (-) Transcript_22481:2215-2463(-)
MALEEVHLFLLSFGVTLFATPMLLKVYQLISNWWEKRTTGRVAGADDGGEWHFEEEFEDMAGLAALDKTAGGDGGKKKKGKR